VDERVGVRVADAVLDSDPSLLPVWLSVDDRVAVLDGVTVEDRVLLAV